MAGREERAAMVQAAKEAENAGKRDQRISRLELKQASRACICALTKIALQCLIEGPYAA